MVSIYDHHTPESKEEWLKYVKDKDNFHYS